LTLTHIGNPTKKDVPLTSSRSVYISHLVRFGRICYIVPGFNDNRETCIPRI